MILKSVYFCILFLFAISTSSAESAPKIRFFGNRIYDDETIQNIIRLAPNENVNLLDIQRKLETTGFFSRVRVSERNEIVTIIVSEKTPWFLLPYFSSVSNKSVYGIAGGLMGIGGGSTMLVGRGQWGEKSQAAALLYRDNFFLDSLWLMGASLDFERSPREIYVNRESVANVPHQAENFTHHLGYHFSPNLLAQLDTHVEKHSFEEAPHTVSKGMQLSHRMLAEIGTYYVNEGLSRGYTMKPYFEFTNPWSDYKFYQMGIASQASAYLNGEFNWIIRPRVEYGKPLPFYQRFELGGSRLRGFPDQVFRVDAYASAQNDVLLTSWRFWSLIVRPLVFADLAYEKNGAHYGLGSGLQVYFPKVAVPALQIYGGYGFRPNGFSFAAAIGLQI